MPDYNINLTIQNIWTISRIFLDVAIMWFLLYYAIKVARNNSRTIQIFKGIVLVLIINGLAKIMGLTTIAYFSDVFINWGFLAVIIIFQPEIRMLLERIGKTNAFTRITTLLSNEKEKLVDEVYRAVLVLSSERTGALISIEQSQSLQDYIKTGIPINSVVSKELLSSIFMTTTPLHDGAVIIQGDKIACASAYFPPTNLELPSRYGARHRAALGISEVTDALTIVVSEETSTISIAEKGQIFSVDDKQLKDYLRRVILNDEIEIREGTKQRSSLFESDEPEIVIAKDDESHPAGNILSHLFKAKPKKKKKKKKNVSSVASEAEDLNDNDMKVPHNNRLKYEKNQESETKTQPEVAEAEETTVKPEVDVIEITDNITEEDRQSGGEDDAQK